jgi:hypothetical protein
VRRLKHGLVSLRQSTKKLACCSRLLVGFAAASFVALLNILFSSHAEWQGVAATSDPSSSRAQSLEYLNLEGQLANMNLNATSSARPKVMNRYKDTDKPVTEEDPEYATEYKAWEAKFRCTNLKSFKKPSVGEYCFCNFSFGELHCLCIAGMASVDSSAPETTSSDNSPTLIRRNWAKHHGPGSDSGSSGKSSDSLGSSVSGAANKAQKMRSDNESPTAPYEPRFTPQMAMYARSCTPNIKPVRYSRLCTVPRGLTLSYF